MSDLIKYKHWELHENLPCGFRFDNTCGSPLHGYSFAIDKSPLKGGKRILVRVHGDKTIKKKEIESAQPGRSTGSTKPESERTLSKNFVIDGAHVKTVNELARQKFKQRLLNDIMCDLMICEIEGWCKMEYIIELRRLILKIGKPACIDVGANATNTIEAK